VESRRESEAQDEAFENVIVLSDEFYREVTEHPIPTDLEAVKALSGAPAVLDFYMCRGVAGAPVRANVAGGTPGPVPPGPCALGSAAGSYVAMKARRKRRSAMCDGFMGFKIGDECGARNGGAQPGREGRRE
jgi:hypothetical protein